jgi:hypothetical protein
MEVEPAWGIKLEGTTMGYLYECSRYGVQRASEARCSLELPQSANTVRLQVRLLGISSL